MTSAFSGSCWADFDATYREDSSFCYSLGGRLRRVGPLLPPARRRARGDPRARALRGRQAARRQGAAVLDRLRPAAGARASCGETEYQIAVFPLGGYVRILGIEGDRRRARPNARDAGRSFASRPLWQRARDRVRRARPRTSSCRSIIYFVFFAGHTMLPAAVIGDVLDGGAAARAGHRAGRSRARDRRPRRPLLGGDRGRGARRRRARSCTSAISRNGKVFERYVTPIEETVRQRDGRVAVQGRVGITHAPFVPLVGVIDAQSPAARAGPRAPAI